MSLYLRLVIGPVIVCDLELFGVRQTADDDDPPPQLNGGQGTIVEPWVEGPAAFGFRSTAKVSVQQVDSNTYRVNARGGRSAITGRYLP